MWDQPMFLLYAILWEALLAEDCLITLQRRKEVKMYSTVTTGALNGICAYMVCVEVDMAPGLPCFNMVGSLNGEVRESKERVWVALKNSEISISPMRITVNLSPADCKKEGTAFDLPIAVGMLQALGFFPPNALEGTLLLGELGLDGEVRNVRGVLPIVREAAQCGIRQCIVPYGNAMEGAVIPNVTVRGAHNLKEVLEFLKSPNKLRDTVLPPVCIRAEDSFAKAETLWEEDFIDVNGQESAKRAAQIAAAGFHNLLMVGPPGAGKSMIAKRMPGIMPPLTLEESLEVTSIRSVAGLLGDGQSLIASRPFQAPHHTIPVHAMIGGCAIPRPGMISLAHRGVLFLDEMPEFSPNVINSMRQPLEERCVTISRIGTSVTYPADFVLVGAMNPCPCGYYPDLNRCRCTETQIKRYQNRISGPVIDRMDLTVWLNPMELGAMQRKHTGESSKAIRKKVDRARQMQRERFGGEYRRFNGDMTVAEVETFCVLGKEEQAVMEQLYKKFQLSARGYHRLLRVARTIADLEGAKAIRSEHLLEAACYRPTWKI